MTERGMTGSLVFVFDLPRQYGTGTLRRKYFSRLYPLWLSKRLRLAYPEFSSHTAISY